MKMTDEEKLKLKEEEAHRRNMLSRILTGASLSQKIEAIREYNPYFYLLTPKPQAKEKE